MPQDSVIAVVEDSPELRDIWRLLLAKAGYEIRAFETSKEFLSAMREGFVPDLVLSDYFLPDMNGLGLLEKVREIVPHLPCILVTGSIDPELEEKVASLPRVGYLQKPVKFPLLWEMIEASLAPSGVCQVPPSFGESSFPPA